MEAPIDSQARAADAAVPPSTAERRAQDLELVQRILRDDARAWDRFVERMQCVPRILDAQNAQCGRPLDDHDLADLSQDVLVLVWRKLGTFTGEAALETWIYGIARFELRNAARRKRRERARDGVPSDPRVTELDLDELDLAHIHDGLAQIDPAEAQVIRCKHFDDLTFRAIARRLGISANTAKTRYYRGLGKLSDVLRRRSGDEGRSR
ncbi:MAG: RNA polymerase sigma factor [Planctomycetota bacterium]